MSKRKKTPPKLVTARFMRRRHLETVLAVEMHAHCEVPGCEHRRWTVLDFETFLAQPKTRGFVLEDEQENVLGFALVDFSEKEEYRVLRLAVHPSERGNRYGHVLLQTLIRHNGRYITCPDFAVYLYEEDTGTLRWFRRLKWTARVARDFWGKGHNGVRLFQKQLVLDEKDKEIAQSV